MSDYSLLINGKLISDRQLGSVINPATEVAFARVPLATTDDLEEAVSSAKEAFVAWSPQERWHDRQTSLSALADRMEEELDHFTHLLTCEQGKPLDQAKFEIQATITMFRYTAEQELAVETRTHMGGGEYTFIRKPLGVAACITPWNFPVLLAANKIAPALLTGNTVILKPAPSTPLTSLEIGRLCADIFPPGVINVLADSNDLGGLLTKHPDIAKVSFTGSTVTGKKVMQSAAESVKRVTLELGGNDAAIVLDDVDIDTTVSNLVTPAFLNAGQVCVTPKRILVSEKIFEEFSEQFVAAVNTMKVGPGDGDGVNMGPMQNRVQYEKVLEIIAEAKQVGTLLCGGGAADRVGYFIEPTVFSDLPQGSRLVDEEQFGPVVPLIRFSGDDEAVTKANNSVYGLGGSVWSGDVDRACRVALRLECGNVWVNQHMAMGADIPFAGTKQSGIGVESGIEGIHEFTQVQVLNVA